MIAKDLRVSVRSVERRRRAWREGGLEALRSAGPANSPTVTDAQFAVLEEELGKGPVAEVLCRTAAGASAHVPLPPPEGLEVVAELNPTPRCE
ncbi:hypothetical protein [Streptomyces sp. NPDC093094]|uniref:hypothetical protein n=1 Tax=Streptomyces sp. NPDC093094 TaxID=3366026 RepID=UPI003808A5CE